MPLASSKKMVSKIRLPRSYAWAIASTGQLPAQEPQSTHLSGSIQRLLSFSEIALAGQSPSQAPQLTHASEIL
jgi:hypothetical protein